MPVGCSDPDPLPRAATGAESKNLEPSHSPLLEALPVLALRSFTWRSAHVLTVASSRLNRGQMMRKPKLKPDPVDLLKRFEERRLLQRPEFRRRSG